VLLQLCTIANASRAHRVHGDRWGRRIAYAFRPRVFAVASQGRRRNAVDDERAAIEGLACRLKRLFDGLNVRAFELVAECGELIVANVI